MTGVQIQTVQVPPNVPVTLDWTEEMRTAGAFWLPMQPRKHEPRVQGEIVAQKNRQRVTQEDTGCLLLASAPTHRCAPPATHTNKQYLNKQTKKKHIKVASLNNYNPTLISIVFLWLSSSRPSSKHTSSDVKLIFALFYYGQGIDFKFFPGVSQLIRDHLHFSVG